MFSISFTFARAASDALRPQAGSGIFILMLIAIAILDDSERREKKRRRKCAQALRPNGP